MTKVEGDGAWDEGAAHLGLAMLSLDPRDASLDSSNAGLGAGVPVLAEAQADSEIVGLQINAVSDQWYFHTSLGKFLAAGFDLDSDWKMRIRALSASATGDTPIFTAAVKGFGDGDVLGDVASFPDGIITFPALTMGGAAVVSHTEIRNLGLTSGVFGTGGRKDASGNDSEIVTVIGTSSLGGASADELFILGVDFLSPYRISSYDGNRARV